MSVTVLKKPVVKPMVKTNKTKAVKKQKNLRKSDVKTIVRTNELLRIARENDGLLRPEDVVDAARSPKSVLHDAFEWDDSKAAQMYRLARASQLIRFTVEYLPAAREDVKVFVSLREDKREGEGGYRLMTQVMNDNALYDALLQDAYIDYDSFKRKYVKLKELKSLFEAGDKIPALNPAAVKKRSKATA